MAILSPTGRPPRRNDDAKLPSENSLKITLNTAPALLSPFLSIHLSSHRLSRTFNTVHYSHRENYQLKIGTFFPHPTLPLSREIPSRIISPLERDFFTARPLDTKPSGSATGEELAKTPRFRAASGIHRAAFKSRLPTRECPEVHVCTSPLSAASPASPRLLPRHGVARLGLARPGRLIRHGAL